MKMEISDVGSSKVPAVPPVPVDQIVAIERATSQATVDSLGVIIPSVKGRKAAYAVYAGLSLVITNVAVAFSAIGASNPAWLTISLAVIGNLAAPFGAIAIANATGKK
jgi:multisubunit Na+/H+ antiporter MnhG subunit